MGFGVCFGGVGWVGGCNRVRGAFLCVCGVCVGCGCGMVCVRAGGTPVGRAFACVSDCYPSRLVLRGLYIEGWVQGGDSCAWCVLVCLFVSGGFWWSWLVVGRVLL